MLLSKKKKSVGRSDTWTFSPGTCPEGWTKEISADGNKTTFKISGLAAKDADGKELTYYVVEETVEGYNEPIYAFDMNGTITIKPDSAPTKDKAVNRDYIINTPEGGYELPPPAAPAHGSSRSSAAS